MEKKKYDVVLKRTVAMFNMLTGHSLNEREGSAFIQIFDLTEEFYKPESSCSSCSSTCSSVNTFNTLSLIEPLPGLRDQPAAEELQALDLPTVTGKQLTATGTRLASLDPKVLEEIAAAESAGHDKPVAGAVELESGQRIEEKPKRYMPPPIRNTNRDHIQGFDWQIVVLSRQKERADTYIVHFAHMPTQAEFAEHFALYHARTHYVHCNEWVNYKWEGITSRFDTTLPEKELRAQNKVVCTSLAPELKGRDVSMTDMTAPWEEADKPFRIRYYSDEMKRVRFTYVDKKPTGAEMAHFHHTKCLAVSQARPKA